MDSFFIINGLQGGSENKLPVLQNDKMIRRFSEIQKYVDVIDTESEIIYKHKNFSFSYNRRLKTHTYHSSGMELSESLKIKQYFERLTNMMYG